MKSDWVWLPLPPTGGTGGSTYTQALDNDGIPHVDLLAREVLQNSWDAAQWRRDSDAPGFRFSFRFEELSGEARQRFIELLRLQSLVSQRNFIKEDSRNIPSPKDVESLLDPGRPLRLLFLEDFGTTGMYGDPRKPRESHLFKALYIIGSTTKPNESGGLGGAFGFGKSAFIKSSKVRTAIAYTRFERSVDDDATRRLIGFTWWGDHEAEGVAYEGRAMFGELKGGKLALPLTDKHADKFAECLGMTNRSDLREDFGSSILLIEPVVDPLDLMAAVERNWWPALEDGREPMDVSIQNYDGSTIHPRPRLNKRLLPFINAYGIARGLKDPEDDRTERLASSKWRERDGRTFGTLGLVLDKNFDRNIDENDMGYGEPNSPTVALVRSPRMVVEYKSFKSTLPIRGVFLADPSIDEYLRQIEPPAHNSWTKNLTNQNVSVEARKVAKATMDRIKRSVQEFAQDFAPPTFAFTASLPLLNELLGGLFGGQGLGKKRGPAATIERKGASLRIVAGSHDQIVQTSSSFIILKKRFDVHVPADATSDSAILKFRASASIATDVEAKKSNDYVGLRVTAPSGFSADTEKGVVQGRVNPGELVSFEIETNEYLNNLTLVITPEVELTPWMG